MAATASLLFFSPPLPKLQYHHHLHHRHRHHFSIPKPKPNLPSLNTRLVSLTRIHCKQDQEADTIDPPDRLVAAMTYLYPFLDGVRHGRFLLTQFPTFSLLLQPLAPASRLFHSSPFTPFLLFLTLYFAVVRNTSAFSRFVRFNAMQAVVLDVLLIFPDLLVDSFGRPSRGGFGLEIYESFESTVFLFLLVSLVYGSTCCLLGKVPRLPLVADAADRQVM